MAISIKKAFFHSVELRLSLISLSFMAAIVVRLRANWWEQQHITRNIEEQRVCVQECVFMSTSHLWRIHANLIQALLTEYAIFFFNVLDLNESQYKNENVLECFTHLFATIL